MVIVPVPAAPFAPMLKTPPLSIRTPPVKLLAPLVSASVALFTTRLPPVPVTWPAKVWFPAGHREDLAAERERGGRRRARQPADGHARSRDARDIERARTGQVKSEEFATEPLPTKARIPVLTVVVPV